MRVEPLMNLSYIQGGDGMMYPELQISGERDKMPVGKYGELWKKYMMENHPHRLSELIAEGVVNKTIRKVDEEAQNRKEVLIQQLLKTRPMPNTENTMKRVGHMNSLTMQAEEIVMNELVLKVR
nr:TnpV protein [uncultured Eisenbergiella sp.]